jgi:hypothetical protein
VSRTCAGGVRALRLVANSDVPAGDLLAYVALYRLTDA